MGFPGRTLITRYLLPATVGQRRLIYPWKEIMELLWEISGWAGAVAILGAYLAVSMGWMKAGKSFQTANLLGACAFIVNGAFHEAWPSVVSNVVWCLISAVALLRMRSTKSPVASTENLPVQFPGVPDTTGPLAITDAPRAT